MPGGSSDGGSVNQNYCNRNRGGGSKQMRKSADVVFDFIQANTPILTYDIDNNYMWL